MKLYFNKKQSAMSAKQSGAALFISLVILLVLTIIGLSAARRSTLQETMASNLHIRNLAFNAAESAIGGFVVDSHTGDKLVAGHVLFDLGRSAGNTANYCYDGTGTRAACGSARLDSDHGGAITSAITVTVLTDCLPGACGGFSLGSGGKMGCVQYQLDSTGTVGNLTETTRLYAFEVAACN